MSRKATYISLGVLAWVITALAWMYYFWVNEYEISSRNDVEEVIALLVGAPALATGCTLCTLYIYFNYILPAHNWLQLRLLQGQLTKLGELKAAGLLTESEWEDRINRLKDKGL